MCRLFALHAGRDRVPATFWLLDAPDSLAAQSHKNPDGTGIGVFGAGGEPTVSKQPLAAFADADFATAAHDLVGTTFLAHVRYASTGGLTVDNTHPFLLQDRMFAHNGVVLGLDRLDGRLRELGVADQVRGQTDSERVFVLVTAEIDRAGGDVRAGLTAAVGWIAECLPLYAVNVILTTATDLWALRYPASHELYVLERTAGRPLEARSDRIHARSGALAGSRSVIVASERMDDDPGWRLLDPGELLHVDADLTVVSDRPLPRVPAHLLSLADLGAPAAASQHPLVASAD